MESQEMLTQVEEALDNAHDKDVKGHCPDTIFTSIIQSDTPRSKVTPLRLQHEAISVVGACIETTMRALTISVCTKTVHSCTLQLLYHLSVAFNHFSNSIQPFVNCVIK